MSKSASNRVICPKCGDDLGPKQKQSTLIGCRRCHIWVNNAGEIVKDPHKHFKQWMEQKGSKRKIKQQGGQAA